MENKARMPNPYLQPLQFLVGEWKTIGAHPLVPDTQLHGKVVFEWILSGAYLQMTSTIDHLDFPDGLAIFGSDNEQGGTYLLYFDERGVSRKQNFCLEDNGWKWWRDDPDFSQRFTVTLENNGNTVIGKGEMRKKGGEWESDLDLTYYRI